MIVTVYTTPACGQCNLTKNWLTKNNVEFSTVDLSQSPESAEYVRELGYTSAPVVLTAQGSWSGFRPDLLAALANDA